jgi:SOS response regulatory protein OraA/RecX
MDSPAEEALTALYARAIKLLSVRMRAEAELRKRLTTGTKATGPADPDAVARIIERLKTERLVDDHRFAYESARSRFTYRYQGLRRVLLELSRLGVADRVAEAAAAEALEEVGGEAEVLEQALAKKLRTGGRPANRKGMARLMRNLANNGHPPHLVRERLSREFPGLAF